MSMRKAHDQRDPAGRTAVGGSGVAFCVAGMIAGTGRSGLAERQLASGGVVIENFSVAAPLDGSLQLAARLVVAEMLIDDVPEKLVGQGAVGFRFQRLLHLAK